MGLSSVPLYSAGIATIIAVVAAYLYERRQREVLPEKWEEVGTLKRLNLFPLKSGHRLELRKAECTEYGIMEVAADKKLFRMRDRCLVVYTEKDKEFRTARTYPKMVLIDVGVKDENHLTIDAPTMSTLQLEIPSAKKGKETTIRLFGNEPTYAIECGDEAAEWFSRYLLEKPFGLRLAYHDASRRRDITEAHKSFLTYYNKVTNASTGLYQDLTSLMLINQASVDDVAEKVDSYKLTTDWFRPNLVVDGPKPFQEDKWDYIKIGDVVMKSVCECTRCILTLVNPVDGTRNTNREPLKTLEKYRVSEGPKKLPIMGIHLEVKKTGFMSIGDKVYVGVSN